MTDQITTNDIFSPYRVDVNNMARDRHLWSEYISNVCASPEEIKDTLCSIGTMSFLKFDIGETFGLSESQSAELSRIVRDTLLNHIQLSDIEPEIIKKLMIYPEMATAITSLLDQNIFTPVADKIGSKNYQPQQVIRPSSVVNESADESPEENNSVLDLRNINK